MATNRTSLWWGPPQDFSERKQERKVSWLELFYDLVYVAAIGQLTHQIAEHPSWPAVGYAFLLFSLIFWSWVNGSQYYDLHGSDGIRTRVLTFLQMMAVAAVAITIPDAFAGYQQDFSIAFGAVQLIVTYLWWSVGFYDPSHRVFSKYYTINYILAFFLLIISLFTSYQVATLLWVVVLILNITPPLTGAHTIVTVLRERGEVFTASETLVERFGLFTIIVLAESILSIVTGIAEVKDKEPVAWIIFILAIFIAFLLWSIYFDMTGEQETKKGYSYMQWLIFLHFPLLASLGIVGASLKVLLLDTDILYMTTVQTMFCISLAIILLSITGITRIMKEEEEDRSYIRPVSRLLVITAIVILITPLFARHLDTLAFLSVISIILFVPVLIGIRNWVQYKFFIRE